MRRSHLAPIATLALATIAGAAAAQSKNPDWRKLADPLTPIDAQPIYGPIPERDGRAGPFDASNVTLLSWIPLNAFPTQPGTASSCWGYISPSGREYALIGLRNCFGVVDITDPTTPVILASIPGSTSLWREIKVLGDYAYGVSEGGLGIQVIDLRQADDGVIVHVKNKTQGGHSSTHTIAANPDSGYLYLCGANISNGGLVAVSTANPEDPTIVGSWSTRYVHEAQIVTYTTGQYAGREIAFCYTGPSGLDIIDVTNKSNMFRIGGTQYPGTRYSHQGWLTEDRRYVLLNDEMDEGSVHDTTTTHVIDVSNLSNPREVDTFTTGLPATDHNLYIKGNLAYEANYRSGLRVFDISDPLNAFEIAFLDTLPGDDSNGYHGAWCNFPYYPSGSIIISDIERGLFTLRLGNASLHFDFPGGVPTQLTPGLPQALRVAISADQGSSVDTGSVVLHSRVDGVVQDVPMIEQGDGTFLADIPPGECFDDVDFWISAKDATGLTFSEPFNGPIQGGFPARVYTGVDGVLVDSFQTDTGWAVINENVTEGAWARVVPAKVNQAEPDGDADGSGMAFVTGATPGDSLRGGKSTLTSPPLNLSGLPYAEVSYQLWYEAEGAAAPAMFVEASGDGGQTWVQVDHVTGLGGWTSFTHRVADFVPIGPDVRVRFIVNNAQGFSLVEAGLDAFSVITPTCDSCVADYDENGSVNTLDFIAYLNDWTGATSIGNPDLNGDGTVNTLDFLLFLNEWTAGCP